MDHLTTTPFGRRPVTAALLQRAETARQRPALPRCDKWELFRELCTARSVFGVTDRDLTVLNALLSFHPEPALSDNDNLIVFPSNRALGERAHGMAESTLRRHLAALVEAGLILRHDSPNGKRYATRGRDGEIARAFGFDLRPLLVRADEIVTAAERVRQEAEELRQLREEVSLRRRDALKLLDYGQRERPGPEWDAVREALMGVHRQMRRKLDREALTGLWKTLGDLLCDIRNILCRTEEMSGSPAEIERHHSNSNTETFEFELRDENRAGPDRVQTAPDAPPNRPEPTLPLPVVLKACPDIAPYAAHPIRHWHELVATANLVRPMLGISPDAWSEAIRVMGPDVAAITLAGILQRVGDIKSPGGYLRALTTRAAAGQFSPGPMIMALLRPAAAA